MLELPIQPTIPKMPSTIKKIGINMIEGMINDVNNIDNALNELNELVNSYAKYGYHIAEVHEAIHRLMCEKITLERIINDQLCSKSI